ncbi:hypothetical protein [Streptomyces sp. NPDC002779]|uniref:hypothetical protein n=1 Tax=Streptomyces sp. NPDC002779 TaxID=3364664 RepID=UPI0036CE3522
MADALKYGDRIHLQNGYNDWSGGYLDTNGRTPSTGSVYAVSTADTPTRGNGTGSWEVLSAENKAAGTAVTSGDLITLRNCYHLELSYLDTNGSPTAVQTKRHSPRRTPSPTSTP